MQQISCHIKFIKLKAFEILVLQELMLVLKPSAMMHIIIPGLPVINIVTSTVYQKKIRDWHSSRPSMTHFCLSRGISKIVKIEKHNGAMWWAFLIFDVLLTTISYFRGWNILCFPSFDQLVVWSSLTTFFQRPSYYKLPKKTCEISQFSKQQVILKKLSR